MSATPVGGSSGRAPLTRLRPARGDRCTNSFWHGRADRVGTVRRAGPGVMLGAATFNGAGRSRAAGGQARLSTAVPEHQGAAHGCAPAGPRSRQIRDAHCRRGGRLRRPVAMSGAGALTLRRGIGVTNQAPLTYMGSLNGAVFLRALCFAMPSGLGDLGVSRPRSPQARSSASHLQCRTSLTSSRDVRSAETALRSAVSTPRPGLAAFPITSSHSLHPERMATRRAA